ncbi:glycosyltransferase family 39 protein [Occallatibacter riparius]|uniref:Glycosyltransferase family 39 protein n=1 Tax=Occallatibacter riparius TaxID=1002689 RepID=A0A9J7BFJ2_9BACT|nr:glycosyltransferase family 39 protein [Occallatibacter riparius]UWZ81780.1 glycosyltransferase family 39 protein [Occallatibacter riparius]
MSAAEERRSDALLLAGIAAVFAIAHVLTNGRYGFHRDELQFLSDARHLDWGFVAYPPLTPFIERVSLSLFGVSLVGLRLASVIGQAIVIFVSGLMARDLGGNRLAQVASAITVGLSGLPIFEATEFQYTTFSYLWWVLVCWFVIRLLKSENPRWWIAIGAAIGLCLMTKYSTVFFVAGLLAGLALTRARRWFLSPWFYAGVGVALLLFLPNIVWLARHDFISYTFLQHIHARDVGEGRAEGYWKYQFLLDANLFATPVWIAGLIAFARSSRYRVLAWMYAVPVLVFWVNKGRFYYVAEAYPALIAMGCAAAEGWLARRPTWAQRTVATAYFTCVAAMGAFLLAILVPIAPDGRLRDFALKNNSDLREEFGWDDMNRAIAAARDSLTPEQRASFGILTGNYGEAGAIENLGGAYQLPPPISLTNSFYLRSYPQQQPSTLIVVGWSQRQVDREFTGCRVAGHNGNTLGIHNEESDDHPDIYVCGPPKKGWPEFWRTNQRFG